ncbi:MAG: hypothetical protein H6710_00050 [Myxococcales bacterium]|nr:hypothetical protein [Myxococcales bacterium]
MSATIEELAVERLQGIPGIREFARKADALWRSTSILDNAWDGATTAVLRTGRSLRELFPDWEAISIRWSAFVEDVRAFIGDALRWFRSYARGAVEYLNGLLRELDEWLGFTAAWSELREWVLRELRAFRSGPTLSDRLDATQRTAGATLALLAVGGLTAVGAWGYFEWRRARSAQGLRRLLEESL